MNIALSTQGNVAKKSNNKQKYFFLYYIVLIFPLLTKQL